MKKALKIIATSLIVLVLIVGSLVYYFYSHVKPILVSEINKSLSVEVSVDDITISGLHDFPNLGITFSGVSINESTPHYKKKLLKAKELSLFVDIMRLYNGEYVIDGIILRGGQLNVADLKNGTNYSIIKPSNDDTKSNLSFEIKSLKLKDCSIRYEHTPSLFKMSSYSPSSHIKLKYKDDNTFLNIKTQLDATTIALAENVYVNDKNLNVNSALFVNTKRERVTIDPSILQIQDVTLKTEGELTYSNRSSIDIKFENESTTAQNLLSVLPASIAQSLNNIHLDGEVILDGFLKGKTNGTNNPAFGIKFDVQNTDLKITDKNIQLNGISAAGSVAVPNINQLQTASVTCKINHAKSGSNKLAGDLVIQNFDTPNITWDGEADLDASFVFGLAKSDNIETNQGRIKVAGQLGLVYDAARGQMLENSLTYVGTLIFENIAGLIKNPKIRLNDLNLNLTADNQKMMVNSLNFDFNETQGSLKGHIENYKSLLDENSQAEIVGTMNINNLTVDELFTTSQTKESKTSSPQFLPLNCELKTEFKNFSYHNFKAESMSGTLIADRNSIAMPNVQIKALEGSTAASVGIKKWSENYLLDISADLSAINITQLFKQFNNFEQTEITDKNLSGSLFGKIIAKVVLDKNLEPILPKLYAKADVTIENGALINYEPMQELSSFVNIKDLENIRFKTLKNTIEIFDECIYIPRMLIENNAINLELEGTHTFNNYMRYSMGLSVAELLATKANWIAKKAEKRIENNNKGGLTAYIIMEGTPDDLKIRYDKATVKENVKEEVKKEKQNFLKALKGEATLENAVETKDYDNVWDE